MTHDRELGEENRGTLSDEHVQAKSSLGAQQRSSHLGRWIVNSYKAVAIITLNSLILFVCLDLAATVVDKIWKEPKPVGDEERPRAHVSYYASQAWAKQYWEEFSRSRKSLYRPYVIWRRAPFQGNFININEDSIRSTPGAVCSVKSYKVFTFGGSTMWGTGAPDWGTIPAYLHANFNDLLHEPVCTMNFGESGFVSTQSVIQLVQELQSGNIPHLVIFYDGVNDIYAAYQSGRPTHQNFNQIADKLQNSESQTPSFLAWIESLSSFHLFKRLAAELRQKPRNSMDLLTYKTMGIDTGTLSDSIVEKYISNYEIVHALAREYGFNALFFWQPFITVGDKSLTAEEQEMKHRLDSTLIELHESVYRRVQQATKKYEDLYYMAEVFDEYKPLVWIDSAHVIPEGNRLIAQKMLQAITDRDP
jgi:hypothetical protein